MNTAFKTQIAILILSALCFAGETHAKAKPWECQNTKTVPYRVRGKVRNVTSSDSYTALQINVRSKVNLCTGEINRFPKDTVETISFGGGAKFRDRYRFIKSPNELYPNDKIVAIGYSGPVVYPANCHGNKCFTRGIVLYQPTHKLARK